jgi:hypothetical protein
MKRECPSCEGCEDCVSIGYTLGKKDGGLIRRTRKAIRNAGLFGGVSSDRLRDRIFTGHVSIGPVTIYGANAMHYAANISTSAGYICFRPTTRQCGLQRWYLYISPNATPTSRVWGIGPGLEHR